MAKKTLIAIVAVAISLATVFAFQNCAQSRFQQQMTGGSKAGLADPHPASVDIIMDESFMLGDED